MPTERAPADREVTVRRTETITYLVAGTTPDEDAEDRYLGEGEEVSSKTSSTTVVDVRTVTYD